MQDLNERLNRASDKCPGSLECNGQLISGSRQRNSGLAPTKCTMWWIGLLAVVFASGVHGQDWHDNWGPWVIATQGEPWPLPSRRQVDSEERFSLDPSVFNFQIIEQSCDILDDAIARYREIILEESRLAEKLFRYKNMTNSVNDSLSVEKLSRLKVYLKRPCEHYPHVKSDESYTLNVPENDNGNEASLSADSIWGILRGLETFSQLINPYVNDSKLLTIKKQKINDSPRFLHRGLLLDTSRHFVPVDDIFKTLDAMSYNKLNVFHWHIVDDNSFPYESSSYPELSAKGAYHPTMVYSQKDVQKVIEYARLRGIRVVPEFDTPGHTRSWGQAHPEFLTPCYDEYGKATGKLGPMNPTVNELYPFLRTLFSEVGEKFPDRYVHLGGDEVPFDCWRSNPDVNSYMIKNNISQRYEKLEEIYIQKVLDIVADLKLKSIVWQEVFDNKVNMRDDTMVHVWTGDWRDELSSVTEAKHSALLSACWYLDHLSSGGDWLKYYRCNPLDFPGDDEQKNRVLGGEACMWGEFVDKNNIHSRIWPRASATAEILWTGQAEDEKLAEQRLEEHTCRMNRRNVSAQPPNGSGFCVT